ncbi:MAG: Abi family protein [Mediterraneibacter gnavus]|uniref:Abi family protein n=1 Tax=Mediterraneibacter gnavus TaxID=33038 RepID=UPI00366CF66A
MTYDEQISFLSEQKQLIIEDQEYAKRILFQTGYFALVNGYKRIFKNPQTNKFQVGVRFEDVYGMYCFDRNLRSILLKYILICEQTIKSSLSYHFCQIYGEDQKAYLNPINYLQSENHSRIIKKLIQKMSAQLNENSSYYYIRHYVKRYQSVPFWVLVNTLTLGQVSKMYSCQKSRVKIQICKDFGEIRENELERMLSIMTKFRNVCAHNDRLFNFKTQDALPDLLIHQMLQIPRRLGRYCCGKEDLFAQVIILKMLLQEEDFEWFYTELKQCFQRHSVYQTILYQMGFPENWKEIANIKCRNDKDTL